MAFAVASTYFRSSAMAGSAQREATDSSVTSPAAMKLASALMAASGSCFSVSSAFTPSAPILSILSKVMQTESNVSAAKPMLSSIPRRMRRSLMFTVKPVKPMPSRARAVTSISSTSALGLSSPRMSMSHWTNSRRRPFWGRSARNTRSVWMTLKGWGSLSLLAA